MKFAFCNTAVPGKSNNGALPASTLSSDVCGLAWQALHPGAALLQHPPPPESGENDSTSSTSCSGLCSLHSLVHRTFLITPPSLAPFFDIVHSFVCSFNMHFEHFCQHPARHWEDDGELDACSLPCLIFHGSLTGYLD